MHVLTTKLDLRWVAIRPDHVQTWLGLVYWFFAYEIEKYAQPGPARKPILIFKDAFCKWACPCCLLRVFLGWQGL